MAPAGNVPTGEEIAALEAQVEQAEALIEMLIVQHTRQTLTAPTDGLVLEVSVREGELARPGGRDYVVRVPGVLQSRLDDAELAAVLNYILTEFNAATLPAGFRPYTAREVAAARKAILADPHKYRRELFAGESAPE